MKMLMLLMKFFNKLERSWYTGHMRLADKSHINMDVSIIKETAKYAGTNMSSVRTVTLLLSPAESRYNAITKNLMKIK